MVNGYCTCGAQLPPDARFCHKCGKPQFEMLADEPAEVVAPVVAEPVVALPPPPVSWRNPAAVRAASLAGALTSLLILLPLPPPINALWAFVILVAGGFWSVHLFRKRTRIEVSVRSGARLGWMAGLFSFLVLLVVFTINLVLITAVDDLREGFNAALRNSGPPEAVEQYQALLSSPGGMAALIFGALLMCFFLPLCSTIGGALGAKVLEKD
jgi:hypothetical protein